MTISDKIRIYELSRDLNLDNKDILDAAQKLSISVKSHSSSISAEEAKKIKNLINNKNSDKKILSIKKPSQTDLVRLIALDSREAFSLSKASCSLDYNLASKFYAPMRTFQEECEVANL